MFKIITQLYHFLFFFPSFPVDFGIEKKLIRSSISCEKEQIFYLSLKFPKAPHKFLYLYRVRAAYT